MKIKSTIYILVLSLGLFMLWGCTSTKELDENEYLSKNNRVVNLSDIDNLEGLSILEEDLKDKDIFFTGEVHAIDKDAIFDIKMVKYLQKEIGLKYYLGEMGHSNAHFVNKYLESGDESKLEKTFKQIEGTAGDNKDDYNFFKQLYDLNATLDKEDKIRIVGIDIEHNPMSAHDYIKDIAKNEEIKIEAVEELLISLKNYYQKGRTKERESAIDDLDIKVSEVIKDMDVNEEKYINLFKEDIEGFKIVIENLKVMTVAYKDESKFNVTRENQIYENFLLQDSKIEDGKYYGQWGMGHVYQCEVNNDGNPMEFLAAKINNSEKYKDKVVSMAYVYEEDKTRTVTSGYTINTNLFSEYIKSEDDCIIFKLNNKNSPFSDKLISPYKLNKEFNENYSTTDYFQYVVILKKIKQSERMTLEK